MTGALTTHVLDTAGGRPAAGMRIVLYRLDRGDSNGGRTEIAQAVTNDDGRTDTPILPAAQFAPGRYELVFHVGAWLDAQGTAGDDPRFLDEVPIRFGMAQASHYHVPLLLSPYGYTTYRGS